MEPYNAAADLLGRNLRAGRANKIAVVDDAGRYTFGELAERVLPRGHRWTWHQALMDLGATICTDDRPACLVGPLQASVLR